MRALIWWSAICRASSAFELSSNRGKPMVACQRTCYIFNDWQLYPQKTLLRLEVNTLDYWLILAWTMKAAYRFPLLVLSRIYSLCANYQHQDHTHLNLPKPAGAEREKHSTSFSCQSDWTLLLPNCPLFNCYGSYNSPPPFWVQVVV